MSFDDEPKLYAELAGWWPLVSAPEDYAEEVDSIVEILGDGSAAGRPRLLELGSGGGNLAFHLAKRFDVTLSDRSPSMLAVSRALNPTLEHIEADMRTLRLGRAFDLVVLHDAVMYLTTEADLRAALETAALHCRPGGAVFVAPDHVRERFGPSTDHGGEDGPDGRSLRYLEWTLDAPPEATAFETLYAFVLREASGESRVVLDRHTCGVFPKAKWHALFGEVGLESRDAVDRWDRVVFVATKPAD